MNETKNILNNSFELTEEILMKYVEGTLSKEETYFVEQKMTHSNFVNDAVEGLENFSNKNNIHQFVQQLNTQLQKQTQKPKARREKRKIKDLNGIVLAVIIVLLLCILGYAVLHLFHHSPIKLK